MRIWLAAVALLAVAACAEVSQQGDRLARDSAKAVTNDVLAAQFPGQDVTPVTDCVIDNATGPEVIEIARAAVIGTTADTTRLVLGIAQRRETVACIAEKTLTVGNLLGALQ
ncbi:succinate dehydrogenase [Yoonia sp. SS1-5]|uniref:Succinate dehydrogenase n=1 Tax=Yoonia rhodophyticola TaxID=3137370 RepID=A0AAN0M967_9RHOB